MSSIQPFNKTVVQTIVRFSLEVSELILNESASFRVTLYDKDDKIIDRQFVSIEGKDYINWGNDDSYIIRIVANRFGFELRAI